MYIRGHALMKPQGENLDEKRSTFETNNGFMFFNIIYKTCTWCLGRREGGGGKQARGREDMRWGGGRRGRRRRGGGGRANEEYQER